MKEISLTQGKVARVDDVDFEAVSQFNWFAKKGRKGVWYAVRNIKKSDGTWTMQDLHSFLMPGIPMIDHRDGDGLNDCRENLRPCNRSQNQWNSGKRDVSSVSNSKGVDWRSDRQKWRAKIGFESKIYHLGHFDSEEDAARAYDTAAKKFHGDFARLNFPSTN